MERLRVTTSWACGLGWWWSNDSRLHEKAGWRVGSQKALPEKITFLECS